MKRNLVIAALIVAVTPFVLSQGKPDLSGVWKLQSTAVTELLTIEHREPKIHMVYDIDDESGKRTLDLTVMTDGKEHKQEVQGLPAILIAKWEGDALLLEIKRLAPFGPIHNRRTMKLSKDHKVITADRINFNSDGEKGSTSIEVWHKQ